MTRLRWGEGPRMYDSGVDQAVLYLGDTAVPWNGLVSLDEDAVGTVDVDHYFDGNRVHISHETGAFSGRISAYTYPDVFSEYNGYSERQQYRRFGLAYRTNHGARDYKLHLVYNVLVQDDSRSWNTVSTRPDPSLFNWRITASDEPVPGARPAAKLMIEAGLDSHILGTLEDVLYGTETTEPRLPPPSEIIDIYQAAALFRITYHQDGSYTAEGADENVRVLNDGRFEINSPTVFAGSDGVFTVSSY